MTASPERLSNRTLARLPPAIIAPGYDRAAVRAGVVHFGPGAFHRAHQAYYFDRMLHRDPGFGVCAVSLRSTEVGDALTPQDGLYALVEREADPAIRVIGSLTSVLSARQAPERVFAALADPDVRFVTATVTEKGYGLTPGGDLDLEAQDIRRDLAAPHAPSTFIGWLAEGLRRRNAAGLAPFAVLSCDNLSDNGRRLARAVTQFAAARGDAGLVHWIEDRVRFPCTMVDSITPATDDALRAEVDAALGLHDAWPVQRERFVQWVIEDSLGADIEAFAAAGATLTSDVSAFEQAKLRLLNGAHSTLAYVGLDLGLETVCEAMADPVLSAFVERMMRQDIAPSLRPASGLDTDAFIGQVLARFRNPAIIHRLAQIAWDGSQKLPFRLLQTIEAALDAGRPVGRLAVGVAAWMRFVRGRAQAGAPITDPLADRLAAIGKACTGDADGDVRRFLALAAVFPPALSADPRFREAVTEAYRDLPAALASG